MPFHVLFLLHSVKVSIARRKNITSWAISSLIKESISAQTKNAYSRREQDDQGNAGVPSDPSLSGPAGTSRSGMVTKQFLLTGRWSSDKDKMMSQISPRQDQS